MAGYLDLIPLNIYGFVFQAFKTNPFSSCKAEALNRPDRSAQLAHRNPAVSRFLQDFSQMSIDRP